MSGDPGVYKGIGDRIMCLDRCKEGKAQACREN